MSNTEFIIAQSTKEPILIDKTSSNTTVYIRKDVVKKERTNELNETEEYYEYLEAKIPKDEYLKYLEDFTLKEIQQQRADIDYISLMTGIDLEG